MGVECLRGLSKSSRLKPLLQERGWSRVSRFSELVRLGREADYHGALADVDHAGHAHPALEHPAVVRAPGVPQSGVAWLWPPFVYLAALANRDRRVQTDGCSRAQRPK